jgi:hypothetical protein
MSPRARVRPAGSPRNGVFLMIPGGGVRKEPCGFRPHRDGTVADDFPFQDKTNAVLLILLYLYRTRTGLAKECKCSRPKHPGTILDDPGE